MNAKTDLSQVPPALFGVALIDATTAAATGDMSVSWWHAEVAAGRAPAPVLRRPRCTRWRLADVREFWRTFGEADCASVAESVKAGASKASAAAQTKRRRLAAVARTAQVGA